MLYIKKGKEPESLMKYRKEKFAYYDGYPYKDDIREKLLEEQGHLCAYCMQRIDKEHMKIEHWYPEDKLTDVERLDYQNMLGVCIGHIDGTKEKDDICDTHKKNEIITVNPQDKITVNQIKYKTATGEIYSDNPEILEDLDRTLNLNCDKHLLKENRKAVLTSMIKELGKLQQKGIWSKKVLETMKSQYENTDLNGKKKEYAGIVLWYLEKKLK